MKLPDQPSDQHHETGHLPTKGVYRTYFTCEYLPVYKHADLEYRNDALRCAFTGSPSPNLAFTIAKHSGACSLHARALANAIHKARHVGHG